MMDTRKYHIALTTDNFYVPHAAAVIASVLKNAEEDESLHFHVISADITAKSEESIRSLKKLHKSVEFSFIKPEIERLPKVKLVVEYISAASMFRLQLHELLSNIDKVIYIDCDVIVMDSLHDLWNTDLGDSMLAGVCDYQGKLADHLSGIGFNIGKYINSGVMLINLAKMRMENTMPKMMQIANAAGTRITMGDQDLINLTFQGRIKILDLRWNLSGAYFRADYADCPYSLEEITDSVKNPGIVHFTGKRKPWTYKTPRHPFWYTYYDSIRNTAFSSEFKYAIKRYILSRPSINGPGAKAMIRAGLRPS